MQLLPEKRTKYFIRRLKEEMVDYHGQPIYKPRLCQTIAFRLSSAEHRFYDCGYRLPEVELRKQPDQQQERCRHGRGRFAASAGQLHLRDARIAQAEAATHLQTVFPRQAKRSSLWIRSLPTSTPAPQMSTTRMATAMKPKKALKIRPCLWRVHRTPRSSRRNLST